MILIAAFIVIGMSALLLQTKVGNKYVQLTTFLWISISGLMLQSGFSDSKQGTTLIAGVLLVTSIGVITASFIKHKIGQLIPIILGFAFLYFGGNKIEFLTYPLLFDFKNLMIVVLSASILALVAVFKEKILRKWYPELNLERSTYMIVVGLIALIALFFGETFGLFLAGVMLFITEIFINSKRAHKLNYSWFLIGVSVWTYMYKVSDFEQVNAFHYSFIFPLIVGAGLGVLVGKSYLIKHGSVLKSLSIYLLVLVIFSGIGYLSIIKEHLGGFNGMFAFVLGFGLVSKEQNAQLSIAYQSTYLGICLLLLPNLKPVQIDQENYLNVKTEAKPLEKEVLVSKDISTIVGAWKVNDKKSTIAFELGPKDSRTKGAFKSIEGKIDITENSANSVFNIVLPMKSFSTFNSFRDEGLMDEAYFDAKKFPVIRFDSKMLVKEGDAYKVEGEVTMKGIKQKMMLELLVTETGKDDLGEFAKLTGKSTIDRSKHNMESDPKIGDIVDFTFTIELRK